MQGNQVAESSSQFHLRPPTLPPVKLQQSQIWKQGDKYFRIVQVERLAVEYKAMSGANTKKGTHHHATKKEFCRLLKGATLMTDKEIFLAPPE